MTKDLAASVRARLLATAKSRGSLLREFPDMKETIAACEKAVEHRKQELAELIDDSDD